jgi:UDP-2,3-diacylglucosamine pyrophosphatase LpxH
VVLASLAASLVAGVIAVPPASAAPVRGSALTTAERTAVKRALKAMPAIPPLITEQWDGKTGVIDTGDPRLRQLVADIAELSEDVELREAATAALAGNADGVMQFLATGEGAARAKAAARKKEQAAKDKAEIQNMVATGDHLKAEIKRVLAGTDHDRAAFLAYGARIARQRDEKVAKDDEERKQQLRARVTMIVAAAPAGSQVRLEAQAALDGGDSAIATFWATGYTAAAKKDAVARETYLANEAAKLKAAEALSDLAKRAERASKARAALLVAHGDGVRALQQAANAMASAANSARLAERLMRAPVSSGRAAELQKAKTEAARQVGYAQQAAQAAKAAAARATVEADVLVAVDLPYGADWALMAQGMSEAATAAVGAGQTAQHAIDAAIATDAAQTAQAKAEAHARQAEQWRKHAEEHAKAAAKLAAAAKVQAAAAKDAAARTKKAREAAEAAEKTAWAAAERTRQHRLNAEAEARIAAQQRTIAEQERANAAAHRANAEKQAAIARSARANAETQAGNAAGARKNADKADEAAGKADEKAWSEEGKAREARDAALQAERDEQTAKAIAQAKRAWVAQTESGAARDEAQRQADEADRQAGIAGGAARSARNSANTATGAAANARASATEANRAANRAWAAAQKAAAAAARADAAADKAEASAAEAHSARMQADAKAAEATAQEVKAARAADTAVRLAQEAANEAVQALWAADRTRDEANAATNEAVAASAQADIAVNAAAAARASSAGIADPGNTALAMVSPFTGADVDADFVAEVAKQALVIGEQQAAAAQTRADEAVKAAELAAAAAAKANAQVKPAYEAAAAAARSSAEAAKSAAEAKKYAAAAAVDGAAARSAAAGAAKADAQARADAAAARSAANAAANDAAIAGRSAAAARSDADAANTAASNAEADAKAARGAASAAEADAKAAEKAADSAQKHADSAAKAAESALQHAKEAQAAAERAEEADRKREQERRAAAAKGDLGVPNPAEQAGILAGLTPEEQAEFLRLTGEAGQTVLDFFKEHAWDLFLELSGAGDIMSCISDGNWVACLSALAGLLGPIKGAKALVTLGKLIPKLGKFLDRVNDARRRLEDLSNRSKLTSCPIPPRSRAAAKSASVSVRSANPPCLNNLDSLKKKDPNDPKAKEHNDLVDERWNHAFDRHAHEWFGLPNNASLNPALRQKQMAEWQDVVTYVGRSKFTGPWSSGADKTTFHLAQKDGKWVAVQFFADGPRKGYLATAFMPNAGQLANMKRLAGLD